MGLHRNIYIANMVEAAPVIKKRRTFRKFTYRGVDLEKLLDMSREEMSMLYCARPRRAFNRGVKRKHESVKTHCRNMVIEPEMTGSVVGVYNGKTFTTVEIKPEMIGHYLGEFAMTYRPVKHGRPGIGATHSSRFIPL